MTKIRFQLLIFFLIFSTSQVIAQGKITKKELKSFIGNWKGSLTYIDYSSDKPYTMPANIEIKNGLNANELLISNIYPNEPKANSVDTLIISAKENSFDGAAVKSITRLSDGSTQIITESSGMDGNDKKPALIRHTYTISKTNYSNRKEVQFFGETKWMKRHEYSYLKNM